VIARSLLIRQRDGINARIRNLLAWALEGYGLQGSSTLVVVAAVR
jgi:hypothetical protein